ncbi:MAG: nuclear transport factor 2 family protein [Actinomycetota bacterium]
MTLSPAATAMDLGQAKRTALRFHDELDRAADHQVIDVLTRFGGPDHGWRGSHPFGRLQGPDEVAHRFWLPLRQSFRALHRRPDVFFAGANDADGGATTWVTSMGHLMGLFDEPWLGITPTGKLTMLRYAQFDRIEPQGHAEGVAESALFIDVIGVMQQAGCDPLPPQTGAHHVHPPPRTGDGLRLATTDADPAEGQATLALLNRMIADLDELNHHENDAGPDTPPADCPPELLARTWHDDMAWYGPAGIGSMFTIERYQRQHQYPFRRGLTDKVFNGHVARVAEGDYAGFFGWPNLTNRATGGFLGLPAGDRPADMRVVDIYRRHGDRLAENWVFIDLLHWLAQQGLDPLRRLQEDRP